MNLQNKTKELAINIFDAYLMHAASTHKPKLNIKVDSCKEKSRNLGNDDFAKGLKSRKFGDDISGFTHNLGNHTYAHFEEKDNTFFKTSLSAKKDKLSKLDSDKKKRSVNCLSTLPQYEKLQIFTITALHLAIKVEESEKFTISYLQML
jgi:hypothetical protein